MKKVIYISAVAFGLSFVSCQKQDIQPTTGASEIPAWDSGSDNARSSGSTSKGGPSDTGVIIPGPGGSQGTSGTNTDGEITDPNSDPDAG